MEQEKLLLASASPRRREMLKMMGIPFDVCTVNIDEKHDGCAKETVMRLAREKALAVQKLFPGRIILGADTLVVCGGITLGKPKDEADAIQMLQMLSGNVHKVYTGVCLLDGKAGIMKTEYDETNVQFLSIDEASIIRYVSSGEPMDKAGAYGVQGMGGMFVSRIEGSPSNVIGLPMHIVRQMLIESGWKL